jgi:hypothetical protein
LKGIRSVFRPFVATTGGWNRRHMARHCATFQVNVMGRYALLKSETEKAAPTSELVETTCFKVV